MFKKTLSLSKRIIKCIQYRCWLVCGGRRTEEGFKFLSKDILNNRKMISELRSKNNELERRIWELEGHTPEEWIERTKSKIQSFTETAEEIARQK